MRRHRLRFHDHIPNSGGRRPESLRQFETLLSRVAVERCVEPLSVQHRGRVHYHNWVSLSGTPADSGTNAFHSFRCCHATVRHLQPQRVRDLWPSSSPSSPEPFSPPLSSQPLVPPSPPPLSSLPISFSKQPRLRHVQRHSFFVSL